MKIFQIEQASEDSPVNIVEPEAQPDGLPSVIHAGQAFVVLLAGEFGDGTTGINEVDHTDPVTREEVAAAIRSSVVDVTELDGPLLDLYAELTAPSLDQAKAEATETVKALHADMLRMLTGDYSAEERDTWPMQLKWAEAFQDNGDAKAAQFLEGMLPTPERDQITTSGQLPAAVMAARIIEKADLSAHLTVIANRTKNEAHAALDAATSLVELQDVLQVMADAEANALAEFQQAIGA